MSAAPLRNLLENAAIGIALAEVDGRIGYANRAFSDMLGFGPGACVGLQLDQLAPNEAAEPGRRPRPPAEAACVAGWILPSPKRRPPPGGETGRRRFGGPKRHGGGGGWRFGEWGDSPGPAAWGSGGSGLSLGTFGTSVFQGFGDGPAGVAFRSDRPPVEGSGPPQLVMTISVFHLP